MKSNVGNVSNGDNKIAIYKSVYLDDQEIIQFKELDDLGVKLVHQMTPDAEKNDFIKTLNEKIK